MDHGSLSIASCQLWQANESSRSQIDILKLPTGNSEEPAGGYHHGREIRSGIGSFRTRPKRNACKRRAPRSGEICQDRGDKMNEFMLQILALTLSVILGVATVYSIRLYLEI